MRQREIRSAWAGTGLVVRASSLQVRARHRQRPGACGREVGATRRGLSLLEVLISMFVLLVGMLGVAALLPVGRFSLAESRKADFAGAIGRAGQREVRVRRMLDPVNWTSPYGRVLDDTLIGFDPTSASSSHPIIAGAFVIDPLFLSDKIPVSMTPKGDAYRPDCFPFNPDSLRPWVRLPRITLARYPNPPYQPSGPSVTPSWLSREGAARVFVSQDDLRFTESSDPAIRPRRMFFTSTGNTAAFPLVTKDLFPRQADLNLSPGNAVVAASDGHYSWLVTASPARWEEQTLPATMSHSYNVSIVVFRDRDLSLPTTGVIKPAERPVPMAIDDSGGGKYGGAIIARNHLFGGGEIKLVVPQTMATPDYLDLAANDWLAVVAELQAGSSAPVQLCNWYRVVSPGDKALDELIGKDSFWSRYVSVVGPDMDLRSVSGYTIKYQVVLVTGVIGVYSTPMQLEHGLQWMK